MCIRDRVRVVAYEVGRSFHHKHVPRFVPVGPVQARFPQPDRVPGKVVPEATFQAGGKLFDGPCHGHIAEHNMREGLRRDSDARHGQPCGHQQAAGHHVRRFSVHGFRHRGVDKRLFQPRCV